MIRTFGKLPHELAQLRKALRRHLHADRQAGLAGILPGRVGARSANQVAWPGMVLPVVNRRKPGQPALHPVLHLRRGVGRQHVDGEHAGEALGMGGHRLGHIGVVIAVGGRSLHDRRLVHAGRVHGGDQHRIGGRPLARPGRTGCRRAGRADSARCRWRSHADGCRRSMPWNPACLGQCWEPVQDGSTKTSSSGIRRGIRPCCRP